MAIHLYAQCWNDEWMLPFFFRHYDGLVDQYFIYDDGSTDATWSLLTSHPRVEARRFDRSHAESFVLSEQAFSNCCWKESRGRADWVIVTDVDEHLCHRDLGAYLQACRADGVTLVPALGFQMISEQRPQPGQILSVDYPYGAPWSKMMKASIFDPVEIADINFCTGRHRAEPVGRVQVPSGDEVLLLHYKYMGFEETHSRHQQLMQGLGPKDIAERWGHKYMWSKSDLQSDWEKVSAKAEDIRPYFKNPKAYLQAPWWKKYRI